MAWCAEAAARPTSEKCVVSLLPRGSKLLDRVARERLSELKASGVALADAITALVRRKQEALCHAREKKPCLRNHEARATLRKISEAKLRNETLGDFTTTRRVIPISALAMVIGLLCAFVALALLRLIGLFTNLFYFGRWNTSLVSPAGNHLGIFSVLVPVAGALIIGVMAVMARSAFAVMEYRKPSNQFC